MNGGTRRKFYIGCVRKIRYPTEKIARRAQKRGTLKRNIELRIYDCQYCKGFHLTKRLGSYFYEEVKPRIKIRQDKFVLKRHLELVAMEEEI